MVAARDAYPEYLQHAAYVCQPGRTFREDLTHMGFYTHGAIQREVPRIEYHEDDVAFTAVEAARRANGSGRDGRIGELITTLLAAGPRHQAGETYQVFLLSAVDAPETIHLDVAITNDTVAASGRPWAWTMGQRYVSLARLTAPGVTVTSDLAST